MSDQQLNKEVLPSSGSTVWCQTQTELVQLKFEWTFQQFAFLQSFENWGSYSSAEFFHEKTPGTKWTLLLFNQGSNIEINLQSKYLDAHVRVTIAILNKKREKIFPQQRSFPRYTNLPHCVFQLEKKMLMESACFVNGNLTIYCVIESLIQTIPNTLSKKFSTEADLDEKTFSNSDQLVAELEELFETAKFSDITFNVRERQFKAHKSILATRSKYFAAMFEHPTKENLTNQIEVEDIEPDMFQEILRFIYTGKVSESKMGKMPAGILAVADKYLLEQLKMDCKTQLTHRMSVKNCLELLLITDEHHPAFHLRKYAVEFFRNFSSEVMATDDWKKAEQEDLEQFNSMLMELVKSLV